MKNCTIEERQFLEVCHSVYRDLCDNGLIPKDISFFDWLKKTSQTLEKSVIETKIAVLKTQLVSKFKEVNNL